MTSEHNRRDITPEILDKVGQIVDRLILLTESGQITWSLEDGSRYFTDYNGYVYASEYGSSKKAEGCGLLIYDHQEVEDEEDMGAIVEFYSDQHSIRLFKFLIHKYSPQNIVYESTADHNVEVVLDTLLDH